LIRGFRFVYLPPLTFGPCGPGVTRLIAPPLDSGLNAWKELASWTAADTPSWRPPDGRRRHPSRADPAAVSWSG